MSHETIHPLEKPRGRLSEKGKSTGRTRIIISTKTTSKKSNNTTSQSVERNLVTSNTQNFGNIKTILPRNSSPRYLFSNNEKEVVKQRDENLLG